MGVDGSKEVGSSCCLAKEHVVRCLCSGYSAPAGGLCTSVCVSCSYLFGSPSKCCSTCHARNACLSIDKVKQMCKPLQDQSQRMAGLGP